MNSPRPPIVAVLGHVDHGKTSLLDNIRKTNVAAREVGGITQSIGAYTISNPPITFIDTPGHQAFSKMRSRGASAADIVLLVVAADDGVKPQTRESIAHIKDAQVPFIVVLTKIDLPGAQPEKAKQELENEGIALEGRGGDVVVVSVSNKTREGIDHLLEMISLIAELHNISGDPDAKLEGVIIESSLDARRGPLATVVVKNGKLKAGEGIMTADAKGKVRGLIDENGKNLNEVLPGYTAQILGFEGVPSVGERVTLGGEIPKVPNVPKVSEVSKLEMGKFQLVVKADTVGRLEALVLSLPETVKLIYKGAGEVTASDVALASSLEAQILSYGAKVPAEVAKLAQEEKVKINTFNLIYEALDWAAKVGRQVPVEEKLILGRAEIIAEFPYGEKGEIAGVKVLEGRITKKDSLSLIRGGENLGTLHIKSMRQLQKEINKAGKGEEFGAIFTGKVDFKVGDVLESTS